MNANTTNRPNVTTPTEQRPATASPEARTWPARSTAPGFETPGAGRPFTIMRTMAEELDRLFENFGLGVGFKNPFMGPMGAGRPETAEGAWVPHVDAFEKDGQYVVRVDLPGLTTRDVQVEVGEDMLVIRGERTVDQKAEKPTYHYNERIHGRFVRTLPMPTGMDPSAVKASMMNGVLEVTVPMPMPRAERRRIQVESN